MKTLPVFLLAAVPKIGGETRGGSNPPFRTIRSEVSGLKYQVSGLTSPEYALKPKAPQPVTTDLNSRDYVLSAATRSRGVAPASCRHVRGAKTAGGTSAVKPARRWHYHDAQGRLSPASASEMRGTENGAQPLSLRRAPLLKLSKIAGEGGRLAFNYSAPRRPSTIAPQVTV